MDRKMMNAWLAEQSKKAQITSADIQRKRLGISEGHVRTQPGSGGGLTSILANAASRVRSRAALDTKHTTIDPGPNPPDLLKKPLPQYDPEFSEDGVPRMLDADRIPRFRNMQPGEYEEGKGPLSPETLDQGKNIEKRLRNTDINRFRPKGI